MATATDRPAEFDEGEAYTARNEGCRLVPYDDATGEVVPRGGTARGTLTVGRGHTGPDVVVGESWSQARCDGVFLVDYAIARFAARQDVGLQVFDALAPWRRYALTDIAFEVGGRGLSKFTAMILAVRAGDWSSAASEEWKSLLPRGRALRNEAALGLAAAPPEALWA